MFYDWAEADELTHAYAVSIHKSQGSEHPAVVISILTQHYLLLQRHLLYTAITRAKKLCVLVGNKKAIALAVRNARVAERWSALAERLRRNLAETGDADQHGKTRRTPIKSASRCPRPPYSSIAIPKSLGSRRTISP